MILEVFDYESELTPISVFKAMREHFGAPCAMLESAMQDDHNQFSLIAAVPVQEVVTKEDSFEQLKAAIAQSKPFPKSFPFSGGLVGYFNWEIFDEIEPNLAGNPSEYPHTLFYEFSHFFAFDHADKKIFAIQTVGDKSLFSAKNQEIINAARNFKDPKVDLTALKNEDYADFSAFESEQSGETFGKKVAEAKQKILDGEIFQMIISNGFKRDTKGLDGVDFYSILRVVEPTTHLVFFDFGEHGQVCGASPEILGSKRGQTVTYSPIAGTRYRGKTEAQDQTILAEMASDPKENAEHDMLLDLGRNDLGKVCETNSIKVVKEKYGRFFANVMHLVSDIEGQIKTDFDAVDFFKAIFPAGTLSGAPKLRAIKLIQEFETAPRNLYGGAMGYFSADGNMELCIAIRSFFLKDGVARFRTGAGVVQDSDPKKEWLEVHNKAKSLCKIFNYGLRNS
ncbi:anthranilate synthase component I family protein [bacterium]|nr:anthranilate synthase component I family protein [bacterium]NCQ54892.1 anthranilate synthase component I family protein [Candidatus Parcubacteria bacterium]NCS66936.1 anthranilate synthase component I family protein [Candidatus Peregrinibacteria bacterium]NCS95883.1 anthranilate synthase component I family protein [bacterium]